MIDFSQSLPSNSYPPNHLKQITLAAIQAPSCVIIIETKGCACILRVSSAQNNHPFNSLTAQLSGQAQRRCPVLVL